MKIKLLARPDHSMILYNKLKDEEKIEMDYYTFNVIKSGSLVNRIFKNAKTVDSSVNILYAFTFFHQILKRINRKYPFDWYKWESILSEISFSLVVKKWHQFDLIHYWPVYCHKYVNKLRNQYHVLTVADVYAPHPHFMAITLRDEFDKFNLDYKKSYFYLDADRNLQFFKHEKNIIVPSDFVADTYRTFYPEKNFFVCSYGNLSGFSKQKFLKSKKLLKSGVRLVYVGNVSIEKGVHYLLDSIEGIEREVVQLDIIGGIPKEQETIFNQLMRKENVNYLGRLSNKQVKEMLHSYDLFVLPSLGDAYSLAVQEALECGVPVIVTENTGNKDDVQKYNLGDVVRVKDANQLRETILRYGNNEYLNKKIDAIEVFLHCKPIKSYPDQVSEVYKKIVDESLSNY